MDSAEELWRQLDAALRRTLPYPLGALTPDEIGQRLVAEAEDDRVLRFVREFYYPRAYGANEGGLSVEEAESLIADLLAHPVEVPAQPDDPKADSGPACSICGRTIR